jgi:hypothetical protein
MSTCKIDVSSWEPKQFEIEYFFPLTEQIPLELDYSDCDKPKLWINGTLLNVVDGTTWATTNTIQFHPFNDSVGYWKVGEGLQMHNKKKPSWLHQQMTKIFFGWKWENK